MSEIQYSFLFSFENKSEDYGLPKALLEKYRTIFIKTKQPFSMNVAVAGSIVMHERSR